jgi:hypothetical protein
MNVEKLHQIKDSILQNPSQFDMGNWFGFSDSSSCGTVACIAGWAIHHYENKNGERTLAESGRFPLSKHVDAVAQEILWLPNNRLFFVSKWPMPLQESFALAHGNRQRQAKVAAKVIDNYIETNGWETDYSWIR